MLTWCVDGESVGDTYRYCFSDAQLNCKLRKLVKLSYKRCDYFVVFVVNVSHHLVHRRGQSFFRKSLLSSRYQLWSVKIPVDLLTIICRPWQLSFSNSAERQIGYLSHCNSCQSGQYQESLLVIAQKHSCIQLWHKFTSFLSFWTTKLQNRKNCRNCTLYVNL